jgi:hypothetical protein
MTHNLEAFHGPALQFVLVTSHVLMRMMMSLTPILSDTFPGHHDNAPLLKDKLPYYWSDGSFQADCSKQYQV